VYILGMLAPILARLAEIDRGMDSAPPAIRFRPLIRAIRRALLGDVRAADMLANMIEGKPGLRRGDVPATRKDRASTPAPGMELSPARRDEIIERLRDAGERVKWAVVASIR
jgi:hypothetical protein